MSTFEEFVNDLQGGVKQLAKKHFKDFIGAAEADGKAFLQKNKEDLKRWTKQLADGDISQDDFKDLVAGAKDLAEMEALKRLGLELARIQGFQDSLISLVVDTAFERIG